MKKHAYLIMAHDDTFCLMYLLKSIDDIRNDIYIHMDIKYKEEYKEILVDSINKANVFFVKRKNVTWGNYSLLACELLLLKEAIKGEYRYYHLLSGHDMPLKSQEFIHNFFEEHEGYEFISFNRMNINENKLQWYSLYNFDFKLYKLNMISSKLQDFMKINRIKSSGLVYMKGSQWFSITHECAQYIISKEKLIKRLFKYTKCCDEVFVQTLIYNSDFKDKLYNNDYNDIQQRTLNTNMMMGNLRVMDWPHDMGIAHPRTFTSDDLTHLKEHVGIFARKFDSRVDKNIIVELYKNVCK